ncbi:Uncharacterised protein [Mycobacteroides abscessus subsp. abscessus]|nr:Uncharacterised protein [Mycobacteroides abscessus subsp. abscessus]
MYSLPPSGEMAAAKGMAGNGIERTRVLLTVSSTSIDGRAVKT